jgi:pimeloyl-[acyl-carrier protein] synthase
VTNTEISLQELLQDPDVRRDPYPTYDRLRALGAIVDAPFGTLLATRHAEVFTVLRDSRFSSNARHQVNHDQFVAMAKAVGLGDLEELFERVMLFADPPDHTRLRRIVGKAFTPRAVEAMRPRIAEIVDRQLDVLREHDGADLVEDLAFPLPVTVISEMLGVPADDHQLLRVWTAAAVKALDPSDNIAELFPAAEAIREIRTYFDALVDERRKAPGDDLLTALIAAEDEGDHLTHDELLDTTILLFGAGHETTVNLISGGTVNLLRHPDQAARLRDDPSLDAPAVEELLRFGPPVQVSARTATTDVEFAGRTVPKGTQVVAMIAAANRDEIVFDDPTRLDVGRTDNRHLAFGGGIHLCLGAPLARLEGQEALGRLFRRFPDLALADDDIEWKPTSTLRGPARLPLALGG